MNRRLSHIWKNKKIHRLKVTLKKFLRNIGSHTGFLFYTSLLNYEKTGDGNFRRIVIPDRTFQFIGSRLSEERVFVNE